MSLWNPFEKPWNICVGLKFQPSEQSRAAVGGLRGEDGRSLSEGPSLSLSVGGNLLASGSWVGSGRLPPRERCGHQTQLGVGAVGTQRARAGGQPPGPVAAEGWGRPPASRGPTSPHPRARAAEHLTASSAAHLLPARPECGLRGSARSLGPCSHPRCRCRGSLVIAEKSPVGGREHRASPLPAMA